GQATRPAPSSATFARVPYVALGSGESCRSAPRCRHHWHPHAAASVLGSACRDPRWSAAGRADRIVHHLPTSASLPSCSYVPFLVVLSEWPPYHATAHSSCGQSQPPYDRQWHGL